MLDKNLTKYVVSEEAIRRAVSNVQWPGRLEKIENGLEKILQNSNSEIWLDGAHNEAGAFALERWIFEQSQQDKKKNFVICGFSRNKCKKEFLEKFRDLAEIVAVRVDGEPYPESAEVIAAIGAEIGLNIFAAFDLADALTHIKKTSKDLACRIVICGSLHLARDVKKFGNLIVD